VLVPKQWCQLGFGSQEFEHEPQIYTMQTRHLHNIGIDMFYTSTNTRFLLVIFQEKINLGPTPIPAKYEPPTT
jgi:hypothetical protein